jgi:hypothetical protein
MSIAAAQLVILENVRKLRPGEVIRARDTAGTLVFSSDANE